MEQGYFEQSLEETLERNKAESRKKPLEDKDFVLAALEVERFWRAYLPEPDFPYRIN